MMTTLLLGVAMALGQTPSPPPAQPGSVGTTPSSPMISSPAPAGPVGLPVVGGPAQSPGQTPPAAENGNGKGKEEKEKEEQPHFFLFRFLKAYKDEFCRGYGYKDDDKGDDNGGEGEKRHANPAPFVAPPFPTSEWQGYPNIGVPPADLSIYPLSKALYGLPGGVGDAIKDSRVYFYGWATGSVNYSTSRESNIPSAYAVVPNNPVLDQLVFRIEREPDQVQQDHIDFGFRLTGFWGIDYRYTTGGGYGSEQLLNHNRLYGFDPLEIYTDFYIPGILDGVNVRIGRYISPPDIEAQLAPDNYLASHSILFAYDVYTQTGVLGTLKINDQFMFQLGINAGDDMAPWYQGATPTGFVGLRWISKSNNDSIYTCFNSINNANYREFDTHGIPSGHDNYDYIVSTWSHRFNDKFITTTEAYYMFEYNAHVGGTPSVGASQFFSSTGQGALLPGLSTAGGVLNYTAFQISKKDYICVRNEFYSDPRGFRTGYGSNYTEHTIGLSHNFNAYLQVRPEVGYYRSYETPAFDNGNRKNMVLALMDFTLRY